MNNVSLVGRITKDPELRTIANGNVTTSFTVAINRRFANQSGEREADFIQVVVWNKQAENVVKYCQKGSLVGITGRIQTGSYDAQDGTKRYTTDVIAENVQFLSTKGESTGYNQGGYNQGGYNHGGYAPNPEPNYNAGSNQAHTTDISEDPFKDFGSEIVLSDDDLPF